MNECQDPTGHQPKPYATQSQLEWYCQRAWEDHYEKLRLEGEERFRRRLWGPPPVSTKSVSQEPPDGQQVVRFEPGIEATMTAEEFDEYLVDGVIPATVKVVRTNDNPEGSTQEPPDIQGAR